MSRVITSPVAKYPGTVTLIFPIPLDEYLGWMDANQAAGETESMRQRIPLLLPGIAGLIERAEIQGLPEHPTAPDFMKLTGRGAFDLVIWLINQCIQLQTDEESPNG